MTKSGTYRRRGDGWPRSSLHLRWAQGKRSRNPAPTRRHTHGRYGLLFTGTGYGRSGLLAGRPSWQPGRDSAGAIGNGGMPNRIGAVSAAAIPYAYYGGPPETYDDPLRLLNPNALLWRTPTAITAGRPFLHRRDDLAACSPAQRLWGPDGRWYPC